MRRTVCFALWLSALPGCASAPDRSIKEYLDPQTAATITLSAPWIFARERPDLAVNVRDYLSLYALEVNRSGERRTYLAAHAWSTLAAGETLPDARPALDIVADDRLISLRAVRADPRTLGIGQPPEAPRGRDARIWYYATDRETLAFIAAARHVSGELHADSFRAPYESWREARVAFAAFERSLPRR